MLARWLPAMLEKDDGPEGKLVKDIENFETRSSGRSASVSFLLPDAAVDAVQKEKERVRLEFRIDQ